MVLVTAFQGRCPARRISALELLGQTNKYSFKDKFVCFQSKKKRASASLEGDNKEKFKGLFSLPFLSNGRLRFPSEFLVLLVVVPVRGLQDRILPEVIAKHLLEEADHGAEGGRHPVVLLLERDHERVDEFNLVLEDVHQA